MRKPFYNTTSAQQAFSERKPGGIGNKIRGFSASRQAASGSGNFGSGNKIRQFSAFIVSAGLFVLTSFSAAGVEVDPSTLTCEGLGYTMKESQCYSGVIRCPYDTSKVSCIDAYVGEIRIFAGPESQIPNGWIVADGRSLPVSTYRELCNAVSSSCSSTFNIPNLSGRFPVGSGDSKTTGSSSLTRGKTGGAATVTLNTSELPRHQHTIAWGEKANENFLLSELAPWGYSYTNKRGSNDSDEDNPWFYTSPVGGGKAHNNMPPYFALYYIIYTGVHS